MLRNVSAPDFEAWRNEARLLLQQSVPPADIAWSDGQTHQASFGFNDLLQPTVKANKAAIAIPKEFMALAEAVACHRDTVRWDMLYQAVWRLTHGEKHLLQLTTDPLVRTLHVMEKNVRRDAHKMKAFVRFRMIQDADGDHYIAWHQPDHHVVRRTAPFFQRRFAVMRWTIMTPDETAMWDGTHLTYGPGVPVTEAPTEDVWEEMWGTFYASIFNPARIKTDMMRREMPVRYWHTMPETKLIPKLLQDAPHRVAAMIRHQEGQAVTAADFLPGTLDYADLKNAAAKCRGCPLYCDATQTVFGTGNLDAALMIVGEQPGAREDHAGLPFIGPAGQLLDQVFGLHGIDRDALYLTNAVKHYKHKNQETDGRVRSIHETANRQERMACKPWLDTEIRLVKPKIILCLGVTAARSLLGEGFTMKNQRGVWFTAENAAPGAPRVVATWHPAAILRMPDATQKNVQHEQLRQDVLLAWQAAQAA